MSDDGDHVRVCVRIRPLLRSEDGREAWHWEGNAIAVKETDSMSSAAKPTYYFDHLFYPTHTNYDIFGSVVKNVVESVMNGIHGSVFTYGQTSSGKVNFHA